MHRWLMILLAAAVLITGRPMLAEDEGTDELTPFESAVIHLMTSTETMIQMTKQKLGLYRDDICLRSTQLKGRSQVTFPLHVRSNTELMLVALSPDSKVSLSIEAFGQSGEPLGYEPKTGEKDYPQLALFTLSSPRSQKCRIVVKRLDQGQSPCDCAVSIFAENGYTAGAKALRDAANLLAFWPTGVAKHMKIPVDTLKPVHTQGVWICTGFTLDRAESIDISNIRSTSRSAMIMATFDNKKADVDAVLRNRAGDTVMEDIEEDRSFASCWWKPERAETYTLTLTNEGAEETLVFYARFDLDIDIPEDTETQGDSEDTIKPTKTL